jgi:hypothetical protein
MTATTPIWNRQWIFAAALSAVALWYALLLTDFTLDVLKPLGDRFPFNSMATHLLAGRFDVDPAAIGFEGFERDGKTYTYFGPFVGIVRFAFLPFIDPAKTDLTRLFCLIGVVGSAAWQLASVRLVAAHSAPTSRRNILCMALAASFLLGGANVQFLRASIYQEVVGWATMWASAFVFVALRCFLLAGGFTRKRLAIMALLAGLTLLTRVSTAIGLYAALTFLLLGLAATEPGVEGGPRRYLVALAKNLTRGRGLPALGLLLVFAILMGIVNYGRWGNPLTFANFELYLPSHTVFLDRLPRLERYGEFNFVRIPYGLIYYFFPVWVLPAAQGFFLGPETTRLIESMELPPGSFLLTDPLLLVLGAAFLWRALRKPAVRQTETVHSLSITAGLAIAPLLMLMAIAMCLRYRAEFYPLFAFMALRGVSMLCSEGTTLRPIWKIGIVSLCLLAIVSAHLEQRIYQYAPMGPATDATIESVRADTAAVVKKLLGIRR